MHRPAMTDFDPLRRQLLGALLCIVGVSAARRADAAPARRPNILFALGDDWSWISASARDDLALAIPTFRRISAEGISFENAFAAAPSCSPSRAAILTGQWPWRLEDGANLAGTLDRRFAVYPDLLEKAGYHVGFTRKGWAPGQIAPGHRPRNPAGTQYEDFDSFLQTRPSNAPFCFWFGSNDPHRIYDVGRGERSGRLPAAVRVPPYLPDVPDVRGDMIDYAFGVERFDQEVGTLLRTLESLGELDDTMVVMSGDNGWPFPRGKATLYDSGTHVPLAIRWRGIRAPGRVSDAVVSLTDLAPTFVALAGIRPARGMTGQNLLPILQDASGASTRRDHTFTMMERHMDCRAVIGQGYPMRALRTRDYLYIRNFEPSRAPAGDASVKTWRAEEIATSYFTEYGDIDPGPTKAYLVTHKDDPATGPFFLRAAGQRPPRELYAVATDPYQLDNLAERRDMAAIVARLDRMLMEALRRTGDPRAAGKGDVFDRYPTYNDPGFKRPDVI
jgi:N-sulfoglucosamine sulfohydrolase